MAKGSMKGGLIKIPAAKPGGKNFINQSPPTPKSNKAPVAKMEKSASSPDVGWIDGAYKPTKPGR